MNIRVVQAMHFHIGKQTPMPRTGVMLSLALIVGIAVGMLGNQVLIAQQEPIKRTVLLKTDGAGIEGKEAVVVLVEIAPGMAVGKHIHPGDELFYRLEGSIILE